MANVTTNPIKPPYKFQEFPKNMHKGEHPHILSKVAKSAHDQKALEAEGYSIDRPSIPEPEPVKQTLTLEERVTALEITVNGAAHKPSVHLPEAHAAKSAKTAKG